MDTASAVTARACRRPGGAVGAAVVFVPASRQSPLLAAFAQDEITVIPQKVTLTVGARGEHNEFSGFEFQPTVRARWIPRPRNVVWGAVSRAVRTPTRLDVDIRSVLPDGRVVAHRRRRTVQRRIVVAYELGYRVQPHPLVSVDIAAYHNEYDRLRSQEPGPPIVLANGLRGRTNGLETEVTCIRRAGCGGRRPGRCSTSTSSCGPAAPTSPVALPRGTIRRTSRPPRRTQPASSRRARRVPSPHRGAPQHRRCPPTPSWTSARRGPSPTISSLRWSAGTCCTKATLSSVSRVLGGVEIERSLYARARVSF